MSFIMQLDSDMFIELIEKARKKDIEEMLWERWLVELPQMTEKTFVSFDDYKNKAFKREASTNKTEEETLQDAENILKMMSKPK